MPGDVKLKSGRTGPPKMEKGKEYVNPGLDDQMEIEGYEINKAKEVIVWLFIILTVGFLRLFFFWLPHLMVKCTHSKCRLTKAQKVILKDQYGQWFVANVRLRLDAENSSTKNNYSTAMTFNNSAAKHDISSKIDHDKDISSWTKYFITKKVKYVWNPETNFFEKLRGFEDSTYCSHFHEAEGLTAEEQINRRDIFGINRIAVHVTPIIKILFKEVLSPFYIFQLFSCTLWYTDSYEYYASCIVVISVGSIIITIYQTRKMQRALRNTIDSSTVVTVCRKGEVYEDISSEDLVPGDVIVIPSYGCIMQCDAVLVTGNCIVNESMLTGESVPVTKTPLPNPKLSRRDDIYFNVKDHSRHVLFCGTHVIQTRYYGNHKVKAVVMRTGYNTAKGELVRSILYPKPVDFKFNRHTYYYIGILAGIAGIGFAYTITLMVQRGDDDSDIAHRTLDLITIAVPPALPAALSVGIIYAQRRLKHNGIYCISPRSINVSGTVNAVCFDKTGTLTEDGLDMHSVVPVEKDRFQPEVTDMKHLEKTQIMTAMATCHSLTLINNSLSGDPLDLIMFEATGWELEEPGQEEETRFDMIMPTIVKSTSTQAGSNQQEEVGIVRQFTFSSSLQRMSVITRKLGANNFELYTKGAPEMIVSLSKPETVPQNFHEQLISYTKHGYRVIALAWKPLPEKLNYVKVQRIQRSQVENGLIFLGLLVIENRLKPETTPVISQLKSANIRTFMITGDNMLTAISVARECGMVDAADNIVLVQAFPPFDKSSACIEYVYADDPKSKEIKKVQSKDHTLLDVDRNPYSNFYFAITGQSWEVLRQHFPDVLPKIVVRGAVFARMSPEQKAQLVEVLQNLGYYVCMCGDGANDCGALKTAHAGISLSEAEASVASPFTSKKPNIECVPTLIREGRAALVTSFGIFKYMACYSLTQFVSVCILYWISNNLTDFGFLYIDLILITTLSVTFGGTAAYSKLVKEPPPINLLSVAPILTLVVQMAIQTAVQVFCFHNVQQQPWFVAYIPDGYEDYTSYENTAVFTISMYQYITLGIVFAKGAPYRKSIWTNKPFLINLALCIALTLWLTIYPIKGITDFFEMKPAPSIPYRLLYCGIAVINFLLSLFVQLYILDSKLLTVKFQGMLERCCCRSSYKYQYLDEEINSDKTWPPVSSPSGGLARAFERLDSVQEKPKEFDQISQLSEILDNKSETESLQNDQHSYKNGEVKEETRLVPKEQKHSKSDHYYTTDFENVNFDHDLSMESVSNTMVFTRL